MHPTKIDLRKWKIKTYNDKIARYEVWVREHFRDGSSLERVYDSISGESWYSTDNQGNCQILNPKHRNRDHFILNWLREQAVQIRHEYQVHGTKELEASDTVPSTEDLKEWLEV